MLRHVAALALIAIAALTGCGADTASDAAGGPTTPLPTSPASSDTPPTTAPAEPGSAQLLRRLARGTGTPPPMAAQVDLYLGNAFTGLVTRRSAADPDAWATCTEVGSYAGRACPLSPLDVLERHAVREEDGPPDACLSTYGPLPPDVRALTRTSLVPARRGSCADDFAVQLFTDGSGRLVAVSLLLGER
jgi:hypothetical protein